MCKAVLLSFCMCLIPATVSAQTAMPDPFDRVSYSAGVATGYLLEKQAFLINGPVAYAGASYDFGNGFSADVWAQYGEDDFAKEIDLTATATTTLGIANVSLTAGAYVYPVGDIETIYVVSGSASIPAGPVSLELGLDHYEGGFESTVLSVAVAGEVGLAEVTLGKAFNRPEDLDPWFAAASIPIGREDLGFRAGVRAFWGAGEGMIFEITRSF